MNTTTSTSKSQPLTNIEDLKKLCDSIQKMSSTELPKGLSLFTKIMNKFGWHRKYEILIFDKSKFNITPPQWR